MLRGISLSIKRREFVTLLGPSGCGKTTTLRIIGGFEQPDSGDVFFDGKRLNDVPPYQREINTVFQRYALFPHLNVAENIAFGLHIKKLDRADIKRKTAEMLELVGLRGFENRDVTSLSGGQQQRVAIARALVCEPRVLLLDEPLGALDLKLRKDMQIELKRIQQRTGITFIYVTHDQEEALTMSDRVVVMNHGVIQQVGSPTDIYNEPVNAFVADFIGESNIIDGVMLEDCKVEFCGRTFECVDKGFEKNAPVDVVIRVAIARALVCEPRVLLLDEPLGALDLKLRKDMQIELKRIQQRTGITFIYVTHDQEEALTMSDRVVVMNHGVIQQVGSPTDIYNEPVNAFVADFIGESNIIDGVMLEDCKVEFCGRTFECVDKGFEKNAPVDVVIRPEDLKIVYAGDGLLQGVVESIVFKGVHYEMMVRTQFFTFMVHSTMAESVGKTVGLSVIPFDIHIMHKSAEAEA